MRAENSTERTNSAKPGIFELKLCRPAGPKARGQGKWGGRVLTLPQKERD